MSLRVQRSGAFAERLVEKQSQSPCDCFTTFAIDLCSTGHDITWDAANIANNRTFTDGHYYRHQN
ncbi:hypothetical protein LC653_17945 [Nostoc sp. CHAB 5784]|uniref:hypothetical protein n=1 Tax=Nostoc mirabile TaxID=2907820 RepID=UPI001E3074AE|nr:hypothetical protein [Nostoc mirabile]MCC5665751.1 hypothetical protein [Nostoc mirabile CHAB5784]